MVVFSEDMKVKGLGYLITGFLHMNATLTFTVGIEFMPDKFKTFGSTCINFYNVFALILCNMYLKYINNSTQSLYETLFWIGIVAVVLFIALVPESPRWLFSNDPKSEEGIYILNYIAFINRSKQRLPDNCMFDVVGQVLKESKFLKETRTVDESSVVVQSTIQRDIDQLTNHGAEQMSSLQKSLMKVKDIF
jgi:hypothetical protein